MPEERDRTDRMAALAATLTDGRRALEGFAPIVAAFPAAMAFLTEAHRLTTVAHAAQADADAASAAKERLDADLAKRRAEHAAAMQTLAEQAKQAKAAHDTSLAALRTQTDAARQAAEAELAAARGAINTNQQIGQAKIEHWQAKTQEAEAAHAARLQEMQQAETDASERIGKLQSELAALKARFA